MQKARVLNQAGLQHYQGLLTDEQKVGETGRMIESLIDPLPLYRLKITQPSYRSDVGGSWFIGFTRAYH